MDVLFLSQIVPYPPHGGVLQRSYNIIREIGARHRLHLLAFIHPESLGTSSLEQAYEVMRAHCATVEFFPLWPKQSAWHRRTALALGLISTKPFSVLAHRSRRYRQAAGRILAGGVDILHVDTIGLAPYRELAPGVPALLTHHNIESTLMRRRSLVEESRLAAAYVGLQAARLQRYEAEQSPRFDVNVTMSDKDRDTLTAIVPGIRTAVVPNGVDVSYFTPAANDGEMAAVFVGGMNMHANRDAVLFFLREIWPAVVQQTPTAKFYVIGQDPPPELLDQARRDPRVVPTGFVDDIRPFVQRSAVYVVPMRTGGGTRLKVLDALAMGKAIVSTAVGAEGIAVTDGRNIALADTPEMFAAEVTRLFGDIQERRSLGAAARELALARYGWTAIGDELDRVYHSIARPRQSR